MDNFFKSAGDLLPQEEENKFFKSAGDLLPQEEENKFFKSAGDLLPQEENMKSNDFFYEGGSMVVSRDKLESMINEGYNIISMKDLNNGLYVIEFRGMQNNKGRGR